jgi:hypothetical protein
MPRRPLVRNRYRGLVLGMLKTTGRLLAAHWPALLAWFLAGVLARYLVIEVAGFVGAWSAVGGLLLMPLAILARLIGFVAMFLVLREGMARLGAIAPLPPTAAERRRAFVDALLAGILPFFAFYAAWGYLRADMAAYSVRALDVQKDVNGASQLLGDEAVTRGAGTVTELGFEPVTIVLIVLAFAGRWAWKRYRERLPRLLSLAAVYLEAVWVFLTVILLSQATGWVSDWIASRQAMVWLGDVRAFVAEQLVPVAWVWEAVEWLLGELGGIVLLPVAWLTIAGVIYGQAVAAEAPRLSGEVAERVRRGWGALPGGLRRRLADVWDELTSRFRPIARALVLMWRAGPVLIGGYVLLATAVAAGERLLGWAVTRAVGPHDLYQFWYVADTAILLAVPLVVEPVRIAVVASAYDAVVGRLVPAGTSDAPPGASDAPAGPPPSAVEGPEGQVQQPGLGEHLELEDERALGVARNQVGHHEVEGLGPHQGA